MNHDGSAGRNRVDVWVWAAVGLALGAHWLLFAAYVRREVAWAYPPNYDQTAFLQLAYATYGRFVQDGFWRALGHTLATLPPTGALLHLEAALAFALMRPSRLAALSVNWLHFAVLQLAVVSTVRARFGGWRLPALAFGLVWSLATPFYYAGGLDDFRLDFAAFCLYGTFVTLAVRSDLFRRHGWALAAGATGTLCVLTRSLTSVYLGGVMTVWLAATAARLLRASGPAERADRRRQMGGALLCAGWLVLVALPSLVVRARSLWNYYVVGHVTGVERAVRQAESGITTSLDALAYYPESLLTHHAGPTFLWLAVLALVVLAVVRRPAAGAPRDPRGFAPDAPWFVALSLLVPYAVLTADSAKSVVVGGLLATPLLWGVLLGAAALARAARPAAFAVAAGGVLVGGVAFQITHLRGPSTSLFPPEARREVARLHADVARVVRANGWSTTRILADRKRDYVPATAVAAYEADGTSLDLVYPMGYVVWEPTAQQVDEALAESQIVIVTLEPPPPHWTYPYDRMLAALRPRLLQYCEEGLSFVGSYRVPEEVRVYARSAGAER